MYLVCRLLLPRAPPRPSPLSLHDALPISACIEDRLAAERQPDRAAVVGGHLELEIPERFAPLELAAVPVPILRSEVQRPLIAALVTEIRRDRKSTRLNSSHRCISYAVFCFPAPPPAPPPFPYTTLFRSPPASKTGSPLSDSQTARPSSAATWSSKSRNGSRRSSWPRCRSQSSGARFSAR